jgi:hypothetical protein
MHTKFHSKSRNRRPPGELGTCGRITLKMDFKEMECDSIDTVRTNDKLL